MPFLFFHQIATFNTYINLYILQTIATQFTQKVQSAQVIMLKKILFLCKILPGNTIREVKRYKIPGTLTWYSTKYQVNLDIKVKVAFYIY